ncbi:uncharacterized protein LOC135369450 [Ornithodoros turicata]|uniref:uncharacterized protein LOC135369450 n=1 Tax=Ornithodoros turicata TaxID=34597 RepID=UPI00313A3B77
MAMTRLVLAALVILGCALLNGISVDAGHASLSPSQDASDQSVVQMPAATFPEEQRGSYELDYQKVERLVKRRKKPTQCQGDRILEEVREVSCQLRTTLVEVPRAVHLYPYPEYVEVERCKGHCHGPVDCHPTGYENKTIEVIMFDVNRSIPPICAAVEVEQHSQCACQCTTKKEHCFNNQYYDPQMCKCRCFTEVERFHCESSDLHLWDYNLCKCECRDFYRCNYMGYFYDVRQCKCRSIFAYNPDSTPAPNPHGK